MSNILHKNEAVTHGLERIFRARTDRALKALSRPSITDRNVHDARKRLKEARAVLRLLRPALRGRAYHRANRALRDAARPFAPARDAKVLADAFEVLALSGASSHARAAAGVRSFLGEGRRRVNRETLGERARGEAMRSIERARDRVLREPVHRGGWRSMEIGWKRVYRNGRDALREARDFPTVELLHEWRKQAKYLRHALQVLPRKEKRAGRGGGRRTPPAGLSLPGALERQVHRITDLLGEDHDLAILAARLAMAGAGTGVPRGAARALDGVIASRRASLQRRAFALGQGFYAPSPSAFERGLHDWWRHWRRAEAPPIRRSSPSRS